MGIFLLLKNLEKKSHFIENKEILVKLVFFSLTCTILFYGYFVTFEKLRKNFILWTIIEYRERERERERI